jgi:hypothetical protein
MRASLRAPTTAAAAVLVALCLIVPVLCATEPSDIPATEEVSGSAGAVDVSETQAPSYLGHVGFHVRGEEVIFVFERALYEFATRGDTGERVAIADITFDEASTVAVAGEFNDWSRVAWPMKQVKPNVYELRKPLGEFGGRDSWLFKFVVDGTLWIEPPPNASNAVPTGFGNDSFNLAFNPSEYEIERAREHYRGRGVCNVTQAAPKVHEMRVPSEDGPAKGEAGPGYTVVPVELDAIDSPLLERLNLPESQFREGWGFKPVERSGGAPFQVSANPMITSDKRTIGFISVFVMPPTPEEELAWEKEARDLPEDAGMDLMEDLMAARVPAARAAYVAIYESSPGGPETGVFALEFSEPLSEERRDAIAVEGPGGAVLASEWVAAAVWSDDRDRSCLDVVRAHVASVLSK